jgi:inner membrane protein
LFLATASHGVLDAMTNGGLGVAFFSPFDNRRYFLPWRPVRVSPIAVTRFFTPRGLAILQSELLWIWLPAILLASLVWMLRRKSRPDMAMPNE